jgi:hypothetical protein
MFDIWQVKKKFTRTTLQRPDNPVLPDAAKNEFKRHQKLLAENIIQTNWTTKLNAH